MGVILLFLFPQLLDISLQYTRNIQNELNASMVRGTPAALAAGIIPLFLGLLGFFIGYLAQKAIEKSSQHCS